MTCTRSMQDTEPLAMKQVHGSSAHEADFPQQGIGSFKLEHNPLFLAHGDFGAHVASDKTEQAATHGAGVRFGAGPRTSVVSRTVHSGDGSSDNDYEGQQRRVFRDLLDQIRFRVR